MGDAHEQEADHLAEHVMRIPEPRLQRACACGGGCPGCQSVRPGHEHLQTKSIQASASKEVAAPPVVDEVLRSPGQPLDTLTRAFMEPRFGQDFSQVRIHADERASEAAQAVQAKAFTVGPLVVFGRGQYSPGTDSGQRLLAHELTHVAQQGTPRAHDSANLLSRQTTGDEPYDVVKFGEHGEANLYRLSIFYGVPFSEVKRLNSGLEKGDWVVRKGDLINLPAGTLAKLGQTQKTAEQAGTVSSTDAPPWEETSDQSIVTDTLPADTANTAETQVAPPEQEKKTEQKKKTAQKKTTPAKKTIPKTSVAPATLARGILQKYAPFIPGSDSYIPYSLNEKGLGSELARVYSKQPAVVAAVLNLTNWVDRDDVAYEMVRNMNAKQLLDPGTDKAMLKRLRYEISSSVLGGDEKKGYVILLDMVLQHKGTSKQSSKEGGKDNETTEVNKTGDCITLKIPFHGQKELTGSWTECYEAVKILAGKVDVTVLDTKVQVAEEEDEETGFVTQIDETAAKQGRLYIEEELKAGRPVRVGLSWKGGTTYNSDKITDHYVLIAGMGTDSKGKYYSFIEVGTEKEKLGSASNKTNRFYVVGDKLVKEGLSGDAPGKHFVYEYHYEVTRVYLNKENPKWPSVTP